MTRHKTLAVLVCLAVSALVEGVGSARSLSMDTRQARTGTTWNECMARARRALTAEAWNIGGEYAAGVNGAFLVAWSGDHGVILQCQVDPNGQTYHQVTMSGIDAGNLPLVEALMRQMAVASTTPIPAPAAALQMSCWDWYGEYLDGSVASRDKWVRLTSDHKVWSEWAWSGTWSMNGATIAIVWDAPGHGPEKPDVLQFNAGGTMMEGRNFETRLIRGTRIPDSRCPAAH